MSANEALRERMRALSQEERHRVGVELAKARMAKLSPWVRSAIASHAATVKHDWTHIMDRVARRRAEERGLAVDAP
ncbi:MAG: hypothetical protein AB7O62_05965 [Pirellulales bacterium]